MSAETRLAIAEAANKVAGLNCSAYFRQSIKPGDAMVRLDRVEYPNRFGGLATWQVMVALPQDIAASEKYLEDIADALVEALSTELVVRSLTPQELVLDNNVRIPVVVIAGTREH